MTLNELKHGLEILGKYLIDKEIVSIHAFKHQSNSLSKWTDRFGLRVNWRQLLKR